MPFHIEIGNKMAHLKCQFYFLNYVFEHFVGNQKAVRWGARHPYPQPSDEFLWILE